jgi:hypothetical protein
MKAFHYIKPLLFICITILLHSRCSKTTEDGLNNPELVFPIAAEIQVEDYNYKDSITGLTYRVKGDTNPDTLSSLPQFRWKNFAGEIYTIVISTEPLKSINNRITNAENIIWQWHSGMKMEVTDTNMVQYNRVKYSDGRPVIQKNILYAMQPSPLNSGLYYWAIWGWDNAGKNIIYSSRPFKFIVN